MDSKPGTRICISLGYSVLFSTYGDLEHAIFMAYRLILEADFEESRVVDLMVFCLTCIKIVNF